MGIAAGFVDVFVTLSDDDNPAFLVAAVVLLLLLFLVVMVAAIVVVSGRPVRTAAGRSFLIGLFICGILESSVGVKKSSTSKRFHVFSMMETLCPSGCAPSLE